MRGVYQAYHIENTVIPIFGFWKEIKIKYNTTYTASLFDVLKTYSNIINKKEVISSLTIESSELHSVDGAIKIIDSRSGYPKNLGELEKQNIILCKGPYGFYIKYNYKIV